MAAQEKQKLVWVEWERADNAIGGRFKDFVLDKKPTRVWTVLTTWSKDLPPALPFQPVHNFTAFLEDEIHDWSYARGKMRYATRVSNRSCWVLLEF